MPYTCDRCGACCRHLIIEIEPVDIAREPRLASVAEPFRSPPGTSIGFDDDDEQAEYERVGPLAPGFEAGAFLAPARGGGPCPMLGDDNLCVIYPTRPTCCVAMQAGSDQCQMAREAAGLPHLMESSPCHPTASAASC